MPNRLLAVLFLLVSAAAHADRYDDVADAANRPERDLRSDALRRPAEVLREIGIDEGAVVLDVGAGGGYYSEVLASLVGDSGEVIMQNPSRLYELFPNLKAAITDQRLGGNRLPNVRLIEEETIALGLEDNRVDLAFFHLIYHDHFWLYPGQMDRVNEELARVVKPGGRLVIIDHAAIDGTGAAEALSREEGAHRLDAAYLEAMMTGAGFELEDTSDLLRNPEDDRTRAFFSDELRGKPTDRFFHVYRRL